ncbi:MAG: hypothetical protein ABWU13_13625 [Limnospira maxima]|uniref:hypothetical protein n=1 Tax=Limnospira sp. Paracas R14 TaxID=2981108 RepID=UPI0028E0F564|nr:hypothetical protein [Limnospira sp. Paracas R14]
MDDLSKEQKIGQLTVLFGCLDPEDLDRLHASFMEKFKKDAKEDPRANYVRKELKAIADEEDKEFAVHHMVISMAWTMFAANRQVHDITHFDEFTEELLRSHAMASLKKARLFLEVSKKFVMDE